MLLERGQHQDQAIPLAKRGFALLKISTGAKENTARVIGVPSDVISVASLGFLASLSLPAGPSCPGAQSTLLTDDGASVSPRH